MGDLISVEMIADLLINIVNIIVLFLITKKLVYKPVKKMLNARKEKALALIKEADEKQADAEKLKNEYSAKLADFEKTSDENAKKTQQTAIDEAEKIITDAKDKAADIISAAETDAKAEKEKMLTEARSDISDIAFTISEKLIGRNITDEDNKKIIDSFFGE